MQKAWETFNNQHSDMYLLFSMFCALSTTLQQHGRLAKGLMATEKEHLFSTAMTQRSRASGNLISTVHFCCCKQPVSPYEVETTASQFLTTHGDIVLILGTTCYGAIVCGTRSQCIALLYDYISTGPTRF